MPEIKKKKINPEVVDIEIGVRHLRKVRFYPLSAKQQLDLTDIIKDIFAEMTNLDAQDESSESLVSFFDKVLVIVKDNIEEIIRMISDEDATVILSDTTNSQLVEIIDYVYTTNFEGPLKNLMARFQKPGQDQGDLIQSVLSQLSPQSAKSMDTDLKTSTEKVSEKAG